MSLAVASATDSHGRATLNTAVTVPLTMFCWFKHTTHPAAFRNYLSLAAASGTLNNSHALRTNNFSDAFQVMSRDSGGLQGGASVTVAGRDTLWTPWSGLFIADNDRDVRVNGNTGTNTTNRDVSDVLVELFIGASSFPSAFADALIAECALWEGELSGANLAALEAGDAPSLVDNGNLRWYVSFKDNGVLVNEGLDTGGDVTLVNSAAWNADHPTINYGASVAPKAHYYYQMLRTGNG